MIHMSACCTSLQRFEPWELRLLKFFIIITWGLTTVVSCADERRSHPDDTHAFQTFTFYLCHGWLVCVDVRFLFDTVESHIRFIFDFQAVALDPNFLDAYINLGNVLKEARIFDRYEECCVAKW